MAKNGKQFKCPPDRELVKWIMGHPYDVCKAFFCLDRLEALETCCTVSGSATQCFSVLGRRWKMESSLILDITRDPLPQHLMSLGCKQWNGMLSWKITTWLNMGCHGARCMTNCWIIKSLTGAVQMISFMKGCICVKMVSNVNSCFLWVLGFGIFHSLVYTFWYFWNIFTMSIIFITRKRKKALTLIIKYVKIK